MEHKVLVLGVGDITLHDEKKSGHTIRTMFNAVEWPEEVDVSQCEIDQCRLHPEWVAYEYLVIVVTVIDPKHDPGTVYVTRARVSNEMTEEPTPSGILRELVDSLLRSDHAPEVYLVAISVRESESDHFHLSPTMVALLPQVQMLLRGLVGMLTNRQEYRYY